MSYQEIKLHIDIVTSHIQNGIIQQTYIITDNIIKQIINNFIRMKVENMKAPNLQQIYHQRLQYEHHKKKLISIYDHHKKSKLAYDGVRSSQFHNIKEIKTKSFISKFNRNNVLIASENLKFLDKLENVKPSLKNSSRISTSEDKSQRMSGSYIRPFEKKRILQTEKQNQRISNKMKQMSSSLNQKKFLPQYNRSQQIKNRLMRYSSSSDRKIYLKSNRYLTQDRSRSMTSNDQSKIEKSKRLKTTTKPNQKHTNIKSSISHYKREEIVKNRIDFSTNNLAKIKAKYNRPNTSIENEQQKKTFFTTEPHKQNLKSFGRKKLNKI